MSRVRRIRPDDVALLRVLRLRALETDPLAFGSTFERELAVGDEWRDWCERHAAGEREATFVALSDDGDPLGLAGGFRGASGYELFSMWVAPVHRRAGHASRLVEAIAAWARASGGTTLALWVTDPGARAFYERCGFRDDGRREPLPHTPDVTMTGMTRTIVGVSGERRLISSGSSFEQTIGYSRAVVDGGWIFVSGCTGVDYATMELAEGVVAQAEQAMRNVDAALREAGASVQGVVRVRYLLTDRDDFEPCWPVLQRWFGDVRPSATMLVCGLLDPAMRIEIEVTARCP